MARPLALIVDHWLLVALGAIVVVAVAAVRVRPPAPHLVARPGRPDDRRPVLVRQLVLPGIAGLGIGRLGRCGHTRPLPARCRKSYFDRPLVEATRLGAGRGSWAVTVGGFVDTVQSGGISLVRTLRTLQFVQPWWLLLLLVLPLLVKFSYKSLTGLGPIRRWVALSARCLLVTLLVLALAEPRLRRPNENVCVLYVVDRSMSVPQEADPGSAEGERDLRWLRLQSFINSSVQQRGVGHRNDLSGSILFARRPRLVLPPSPVDKLIVTDALAGAMDPNYTDIAAAIKLAMASFPELARASRIVLFSDGERAPRQRGRAGESRQAKRRCRLTWLCRSAKAIANREREVLVQEIRRALPQHGQPRESPAAGDFTFSSAMPIRRESFSASSNCCKTATARRSRSTWWAGPRKKSRRTPCACNRV